MAKKTPANSRREAGPSALDQARDELFSHILRCGVLEAAPEQFQRHGVAGPDTEGLVDLPRTIEGVDVVVLISEVESGKVKVSMRSTGRVAIDGVASRFGGGGHLHAAGVLMHRL